MNEDKYFYLGLSSGSMVEKHMRTEEALGNLITSLERMEGCGRLAMGME